MIPFFRLLIIAHFHPFFNPTLFLASSSASLKFIAFGDWGGLPVFPYRTFVEIAVGREIADFSKQSKLDAIITLGDNFYLKGVENVEDKRFRETFELAFSYDSLNVPWLVVAGNHDHYGNVSAEIAYSQKSSRWYFPDYFYVSRFKVPFSNKTVDVVMIDTVILCGNVPLNDTFKQPAQSEKEKITSYHYWTWLDDTLKYSRADFILVCGHFPVYSIGTHGPTECLVERLEPLLKKYRVSAYFSGHDHNLQHIQVESEDGAIDYFVSGSTNTIDPSKKNLNKIPSNSLRFHWGDPFSLGGFSCIDISDTNLTISFVLSNGDLLYSYLKHPRKF